MTSPTSRDYADPSVPPRLCQNCNTPLRGPFCSQCGQHDIDYHRSFHYLTHDLLENVFHFEGKFFTSVAWLLAKPGRLTREFLAGRRQSQLNPLRFYLFVSVLFFLVLTLLNHGHLFNVGKDALLDFSDASVGATSPSGTSTDPLDRAAAAAEQRIVTAAEKNGRVDAAELKETLRQARETLRRPTSEASPAVPKKRVHSKGEFSDTLSRKLQKRELTVSQMVQELEHRVPTLFFLGVPLFALLLKLFYIRSGRFYIEHLIFSLHLHTWAFLAALMGNGYGRLFGLGPAWLSGGFRFAFTVWLVAYVLLAVRFVYEQSWKKTVLKTGAVAIAYSFCLAMLAGALALATILWLAYE